MAIRKLTDPAIDTLYDVCIIGSGPAGLTLCNELAHSGKKICVLESGTERPTKQEEGLKKVVSAGEIHIKDTSRERAFGGTSHTWAGLSAPLDDVDLEHWPISSQELTPYYEQLHKYGFAAFDRFNVSSYTKLRDAGNLAPKWRYLQEKIFIAADPPLNFGKKFGHLFTDGQVDLCLDSTVVGMNAQDKTTIDSMSVVNKDGRRANISARVFILCAGGIESARLLLLPSRSFPKGIGNEHGQVGKYLMNHPKNNAGILELSIPVQKLSYFFGYLEKGFATYAGLRLSDELQRTEGLLNSYIRFEPIFPWTDSAGVQALITLAKRAQTLLSWWKNRQKHAVSLKDWNETGDDRDHLGTEQHASGWFRSFITILFDLRAVTAYVVNRLQSKKYLPVKKIRIRNFMEMAATADNYMALSSEVDRHGNPLPVVHLNITERDKKSLIRLHATLKEEVARLGIGKFVSDLDTTSPWPIVADASHHLGGTIMGTSPEASVVDSNLKVHSIENLYVCSGSVFPSSGCANPTYTICALAIRLAEHLQKATR